MSSNEEAVILASNHQLQALSNTPWYADFNTVMNVSVIAFLVIGTVSGFITIAIASENGRGKATAFMAGFFMGILGIVTYAIMGETIEQRVAIEEKVRRKITRKLKENNS